MPLPLSAEQIRELAQRAFGDLGPAIVELMTQIALAESGGQSIQSNYIDPRTGQREKSYGPWQISAVHGFDSQRLLSDPAYNVAAARAVYDKQGLTAWSVFPAVARSLGIDPTTLGHEPVHPELIPGAEVFGHEVPGAIPGEPISTASDTSLGLPPRREPTFDEYVAERTAGYSAYPNPGARIGDSFYNVRPSEEPPFAGPPGPSILTQNQPGFALEGPWVWSLDPLTGQYRIVQQMGRRGPMRYDQWTPSTQLQGPPIDTQPLFRAQPDFTSVPRGNFREQQEEAIPMIAAQQGFSGIVGANGGGAREEGDNVDNPFAPKPPKEPKEATQPNLIREQFDDGWWFINPKNGTKVSFIRPLSPREIQDREAKPPPRQASTGGASPPPRQVSVGGGGPSPAQIAVEQDRIRVDREQLAETKRVNDAHIADAERRYKLAVQQQDTSVAQYQQQRLDALQARKDQIAFEESKLEREERLTNEGRLYEANQSALTREFQSEQNRNARLASAQESAANRAFQGSQGALDRALREREFAATQGESALNRAQRAAEFASQYGLDVQRLGLEQRGQMLQGARQFADVVNSTDPAAFAAFQEAGGGVIQNALSSGASALSRRALLPGALTLAALDPNYGRNVLQGQAAQGSVMNSPVQTADPNAWWLQRPVEWQSANPIQSFAAGGSNYSPPVSLVQAASGFHGYINRPGRSGGALGGDYIDYQPRFGLGYNDYLKRRGAFYNPDNPDNITQPTAIPPYSEQLPPGPPYLGQPPLYSEQLPPGPPYLGEPPPQLQPGRDPRYSDATWYQIVAALQAEEDRKRRLQTTGPPRPFGVGPSAVWNPRLQSYVIPEADPYAPYRNDPRNLIAARLPAPSPDVHAFIGNPIEAARRQALPNYGTRQNPSVYGEYLDQLTPRYGGYYSNQLRGIVNPEDIAQAQYEASPAFQASQPARQAAAQAGRAAYEKQFGPIPAAGGFGDVINQPTYFLAGEAGPERVDITPLEPYLNRVQNLRQGVKYPQLNPFDVSYSLLPPTVQEYFLRGRQAKYGLPVNDQLAEIRRFALPGAGRGSVRVGY